MKFVDAMVAAVTASATVRLRRSLLRGGLRCRRGLRGKVPAAHAAEPASATIAAKATAAGATPAARAALPVSVPLADVREAVGLGADEIDMVIDRGAFLSGRYMDVYEEIAEVREACARPDGRH